MFTVFARHKMYICILVCLLTSYIYKKNSVFSASRAKGIIPCNFLRAYCGLNSSIIKALVFSLKSL